MDLDEQKIAGMQSMDVDALERDRIVWAHGDDGVVADLMAGRENVPEIMEHAAVELDLIPFGKVEQWLKELRSEGRESLEDRMSRGAEIGHHIVAGPGCKYEGVVAVAAGQAVIAVAADQAIVAASAEQEIVAAL